jgi:hypothetical protein
MVSGLTSKRQKVIAVAADEDQSLRTSMAKDLFIGCADWQHRAVTLCSQYRNRSAISAGTS